MPPLQRFINCGLTDHFDWLHFSVYSFIALLELLHQQSKSLDAARAAPLPVLLVAFHPIAPSVKMAI
jgi:hypothetical protein